jgi:hypothetical protein
VVDYLTSKHKVLSSNSIPKKKRKKKIQKSEEFIKQYHRATSRQILTKGNCNTTIYPYLWFCSQHFSYWRSTIVRNH